MKRIIPWILIISLLFTMAACNVEDEYADGHAVLSPQLTILETPIPYATPRLWAENYTDEMTSASLGYDDLSQQDIEDLYVLGKVWGFLKYYHPNIRAGQFDWDMELMGILPAYAAVASPAERDQLLLEWIQALGAYTDEVDEHMNMPADATVARMPDYSWMDDLTDPALQQALQDILNVQRGEEQHYVTYNEVGGYTAQNEALFSNHSFTHAGARILTLFRYWNVYCYYSPYLEITDKPWDDVLKEMIPSFVNGEEDGEFLGSLRRLSGYTGDEHTYYWGSHSSGNTVFGKYALPLKARYFNEQLVLIDSYEMNRPLEDMGLMAGDVLTHIDGVPVEERYQSLDPFVPTSHEERNRQYLWDFYLFRTHNINMELTVMRDGQTVQMKTFTNKLRDIQMKWHHSTHSAETRKMVVEDLGDGIVYLNLDNVGESDLDKNRDVIMSSKVMIWDLRGYPDYQMMLNFFDMILPQPLNATNITMVYPNTPGIFVDYGSEMVGTGTETPFEGQVIALVDGNAKSRPEYFAMYVKAMPNGTVLGQTTVGVDGDTDTIVLPFGINVQFTSIGIEYPDGSATQRIGIVPDVWLDVTKEGVLAGRDEILEQALEYIRTMELN